MTQLASSLVIGFALLAAASLGTPTAAAASQRAITQAPTQQVNAEYAQYRRYGYARPGVKYYRRGYNRGGALAAGAALGILGGAAAAAAAPTYYGAPYGYGYAAPAYGYGYAAPAYGYGARGCDPYYGC